MTDRSRMHDLDTGRPIWDCFHLVAPLVLVGTVEPDETFDLAPKHLAMPMSWGNLFGFVCSDTHATYRNAVRVGSFTVSVPRPGQLVFAALAAEPRCEDGSKPDLRALPTVEADQVPGRVLEDAVAVMECRLARTVEGLEENALVVGRIVAARVAADALRSPDVDDLDLVAASPLLAYLHPWRYAIVDRSSAFPLPEGMRR